MNDLRFPLRGRTLLVARARSGASRLAARFRELGAHVIEVPRVERDVRADLEYLGAELRSRQYGAVIVASEEASVAVARAVESHRATTELPSLVAIGETAAAALRSQGLFVVCALSRACADSLRGVESSIKGRRVLVPVTDRGRPVLIAELEALGASVSTVVIASDRHTWPEEWPSDIDLVALPSSSAARALYSAAPPHVRRVPTVAIGEHTEAAATQAGVESVVTAGEDTIEALVQAAVDLVVRLTIEQGPQPPARGLISTEVTR